MLAEIQISGRVAEHSCERRVGIDDPQVLIGDNDRAVGPVGDQIEQCQLFP